MRPRRIALTLAAALSAIVLTIAACGSDDDGENPTTTPAPTETPSEGATPSAGALPPQLLECFADRGYEVESPDEIHQAPQEVVDECFGQLHEGGAGP